ncbi:hypothetical protein MMC26_007556 [Xylographa opegraphella]|nr:hypothetical protein [Xylographa opegraphella]
MFIVRVIYDFLPYIDLDISAQARTEVYALLAKELPETYACTLHPLLPALPSPKLSLNDVEIERVAGKQCLAVINVGRYEIHEAPATSGTTSDETNPEFLEAWKTKFQDSYASSVHLQTRLQNLMLLNQFGKNAWLIGNAQLEGILKEIERKLLETKEQIGEVGQIRQFTQEGVKREMDGLCEEWKKGIGRLVEVQLAIEQAGRVGLARRRENAA